MSNEYKDYMNDLRAIFNYKMREVEFLYDGWRNSFVPAMMDEMFSALGSYVEDFEVYQIKEKYGSTPQHHNPPYHSHSTQEHNSDSYPKNTLA